MWYFSRSLRKHFHAIIDNCHQALLASLALSRLQMRSVLSNHLISQAVWKLLGCGFFLLHSFIEAQLGKREGFSVALMTSLEDKFKLNKSQ